MFKELEIINFYYTIKDPEKHKKRYNLYIKIRNIFNTLIELVKIFNSSYYYFSLYTLNS